MPTGQSRRQMWIGGLPLIVAARLASAVRSVFDGAECPSGLRSLADRLPARERLSLRDRANDFFYHQALLQSPSFYRKGAPTRSDLLIEIVDSAVIFQSTV